MWETVKLGDVCDFQNGFAFKSSLFKEEGEPILRISNIQQDKIEVKNLVYFSEHDYDIDFRRYRVEQGDLLIAMSGATTGKLGFNSTNQVFYLNQRVGKFTPKENLNKKYLYYLLSTKVEENLSISKGAAQPNLSTEQIKNIEFPILPLAEQQRIVAKLDAAFAQIDKALQIVKREKLEYFKFSKAVILRKLEKIDKKSYKKFEEVCSFVRGPFGGNLKKSMFVESGYAVYEQQHPINDQFDKFRYFITSSKFDEMQRFAVNAGDVLMSCSGTLGKIGIVPSNAPEGIINQALLKITPFEGLSCDYLQLVMRSEIFQKLIWGVSGGTTQLNVPSIKTIKSLQLPMPPISEQIEIVEWAKTLQSQNLSEIYTKKYNAFGRLKSSILTQELQREAA